MPGRLVCRSYTRRQTDWSVRAILDARQTGLSVLFWAPDRLVCLSNSGRQTDWSGWAILEVRQSSLCDSVWAVLEFRQSSLVDSLVPGRLLCVTKSVHRAIKGLPSTTERQFYNYPVFESLKNDIVFPWPVYLDQSEARMPAHCRALTKDRQDGAGGTDYVRTIIGQCKQTHPRGCHHDGAETSVSRRAGAGVISLCNVVMSDPWYIYVYCICITPKNASSAIFIIAI